MRSSQFRKLREFAWWVNEVMTSIPRPSPPGTKLEDTPKGALPSASAVIEAYEQMPGWVQDATRPEYQRCLRVLASQEAAADAAMQARAQVFADIEAVIGESPEVFLREMSGPDDHRALRKRELARVLRWVTVAALAIAAGIVVTLAVHRFTTPAPTQTFKILVDKEVGMCVARDEVLDPLLEPSVEPDQECTAPLPRAPKSGDRGKAR